MRGNSWLLEAIVGCVAFTGTLGLALEAAGLKRAAALLEPSRLSGATGFIYNFRLPQLSLAATLAMVAFAGLALRKPASRSEGRTLLLSAAILAWVAGLYCLYCFYLPVHYRNYTNIK